MKKYDDNAQSAIDEREKRREEDRKDKLKRRWEGLKIRNEENKVVSQYEYYKNLLDTGWGWSKSGIGNIHFRK